MADDELMELVNDDEDPRFLLNLSGSRSTFLAPPLLGTKRGRSNNDSSSSGLVLEPLNREEDKSSSSVSSTGFLLCGLLILDLSLLNCLASLESSSSTLETVSGPVSGRTLSTGLRILDLESCERMCPVTRVISIILSIMVMMLCCC